MPDEVPAILSHVSIGTNDFERATGFYDAAIAAGGGDDGPPGPRPMYGPEYYGCFVYDLDGHKIEASLIG